MSGGWGPILFHRARQVGKTHAMAEACKKLNGVMVCLNTSHAREVAKKYGIRTVSVLDGPDKLRGMTEPVVFDPEAVAVIDEINRTEIEKEQDAGEKAERRIAELEQRLRVATFRFSTLATWGDRDNPFVRSMQDYAQESLTLLSAEFDSGGGA